MISATEMARKVMEENNLESLGSDTAKQSPAVISGVGASICNMNFFNVAHNTNAEPEDFDYANALFHKSINGVVICDTQGKVLHANQGFAAITGYSQTEVAGKSLTKLSTGESSSDVFQIIANELFRSGNWEGSFKLQNKDGSSSSTRSTFNLVAEDGETPSYMIGFMCRDTSPKNNDLVLTSRVRDLERRNMQLIETASALQKESHAKSDFIANTSHELRTYLNIIIGFSDVIASEVMGKIDNDDYVEYAKHINESGAQILQFVNGLLDISKIESGRMEIDESNFAIDELAETAIATVRNMYSDKKILMTSTSSVPGIMINADKTRILQVLVNLLSNAVKFTQDDGWVDLSIKLNDKGDLLLAVNDNGIGIEKDDIAKILTPFSQGSHNDSNLHGGTGLGLPLCKSFVELHGGVLSIESTPREGTTVSARLPANRITS